MTRTDTRTQRYRDKDRVREIDRQRGKEKWAVYWHTETEKNTQTGGI